MIGCLQGRVLSISQDMQSCVLDVSGIGYEMTLPRSLYLTLEAGAERRFWIHTHVREDVLALFAFETELERDFFRLLLSTSGLGPKTALALMSEHGAERLVHHVRVEDISAISEAPGVGKKLAQRLVLELAGKIDKWVWRDRVATRLSTPAVLPTEKPSRLREDLASALENLGFPASQVKLTLDRFIDEPGVEDLGFEGSLKRALSELNRRPLTPSAT